MSPIANPVRAGITSLRSVSGLAMLLDPAEGMIQTSAGSTPATANNDPVGKATDLGRNGNSPLQGTDSRRGTLKTNIVNGYPVVRFNPALTQFLRAAAVSAGLTGSAVTFVAVVKAANLGASNFLLDGSTNAASRKGVFVSASGRWSVHGGGTSFPGPANSADFCIIIACSAGASSYIRVNGAHVAGSVTASNLVGLTLAANSTPSLYGDLDFAILGGYGRALTASECGGLERFLSRKFNITTPAIAIKTPTIALPLMRQRSALGTASLPVTGAYSLSIASGAPVVQGRFAGGAWSDVGAAFASDGTFGGNVAAVAGQGAVEVRAASNIGISDTTGVYAASVGDVFLIGPAQSNGQGRLDNFQDWFHATLEPQMFRESVTFWRDLAEPTDSDSSWGSIWPLLATLIMAQENVPVGFITTAEGGTGLVAPSANWAVGGNSFDNCVLKVAQSGVNGLKAMLSLIGEEDAKNGTSTAAFVAAYSASLDGLQAAFGLGPVKAILCQIGPNTVAGVTREKIDAIRTAVTRLWDEDPDVLEGALFHDLVLTDTVHLTSDTHGQIAAGRIFRAVNYHLYGGTQGPAPRFLSATKVDATHIDVAFTLGGTTSLVVGASPTLGWIVTDAGGTRAVTAVALQNATTLRLTLGTALGANPVITFGSGNDSSGCTILDNGTYPAPPVPFLNKTVSV